MDGSRLLILILILIVAGVIGGTFIVEAIRKKDFGDQVSGKKPEHKLGKNQKISYDNLRSRKFISRLSMLKCLKAA